MPIASLVEGVQTYVPPQRPQPTFPELGSPESAAIFFELYRHLALRAEQRLKGTTDHYPNGEKVELERILNEKLGASVLVTSGADGALDAVVRAYVGAGRNLVTTVPTFGTALASTESAGGEIRKTRWWSGPFPVDAFLSTIDENTGIILLTSPQNPTGQVIPFEAIEQIRKARPDAILVVDSVYATYADVDDRKKILSLPDTVMIDSFSKGCGMAGARIGYAASTNSEIIKAIGKTSLHMPCAGHSIAMAIELMQDPAAQALVADSVKRVKAHRGQLQETLGSTGFACLPSQTNFVLTQCATAEEAALVGDLLAAGGVAPKSFQGNPDPELARSLRLGVPEDPAAAERLFQIIKAARSPDCIIFDASIYDAVDPSDVDTLITAGCKTGIIEGRGAHPAMSIKVQFTGGGATVCAGKSDGELDRYDFIETMGRHHVKTAWYVGNDPKRIEEVRAVSRITGGELTVIPIGFSGDASPNQALLEAGGARVVGPNGLSDLLFHGSTRHEAATPELRVRRAPA